MGRKFGTAVERPCRIGHPIPRNTTWPNRVLAPPARHHLNLAFDSLAVVKPWLR